VQISAKVDYAMRALLVLASATEPLSAEAIAAEQGLPAKFLGVILNDLRHAGILASHRGRDAGRARSAPPGAGYLLARPASEVTAADVIRALEGPLAQVRGTRPEAVTYGGAAAHLQEAWVAVRASLRGVLEHLTLEQIKKGEFPPEVAKLVADPDAWVGRRL
jgi:Rrf2 family protein